LLQFYGPEKLIRAQWEYTKEKFGQIPGATFREGDFHKLPLTEEQKKKVHGVSFGIPNLSIFFIGARSEVVEGVVVERGSVLGMGVYIGQSTRIYDRETGEVHYGRVPAGSVVVAGNLPSKDGKYSLYCAVIVKKVDEKTRAKTSLNELLRAAD